MEDFERFLKAHAPLPIFVATDNAETQERLRERFGERVQAMKPIVHASGALRHTPLTDAVVELFTCVAARVFKGSYASSFSDTIHHVREVTGTRHAGDEHSIAKASEEEKDGGEGMMSIELLMQGMMEMAQEDEASAGRF